MFPLLEKTAFELLNAVDQHERLCTEEKIF
jgi:hypothetical protein